MEVELKLRILTQDTFAKILKLFHSLPTASYKQTLIQTNVFIDSTLKELAKQRINFRLRSSTVQQLNGTMQAGTGHIAESVTKSYLTMKGKDGGDSRKHINNGVLRVAELEQEIPNSELQEMIANPSVITKFQGYELVKELLDSTQGREFEIVGKFTNKRTVFEWKGLILECDETDYDFGKAFEIEVENSDPETAKKELYLIIYFRENLFGENGIEFGYSKRGKFGNMKAGAVL